MNVRRIFHPTDFSPSADAALRFALQIAARFEADLYVGHVVQSGRAPQVGAIPIQTKDAKIEAKLRELVDGHLTELSPGTAKGLRTKHFVIRSDSAAAGIVRFAARHAIDLIVLGTHGRRGVRRLLLGSVALQVLHTARTDTVLVPAYAEVDTAARILVPVDLFGRSTEQIAAAALIARRLGAEIDLLHVLEIREREQMVPYQSDSAEFVGLLDVVDRRLDTLAQSASPDVPVVRHVASGRAAPVIVRFIHGGQSDLVVMASGGMNPTERALLQPSVAGSLDDLRWAVGPVTERVVTQSDTPVWVVKKFSDQIPVLIHQSLEESTVYA